MNRFIMDLWQILSDLFREAPGALWLLGCWTTVIVLFGSKLALSLSHHPNTFSLSLLSQEKLPVVLISTLFIGFMIGFTISYLLNKRRFLSLLEPLPKGKELGIILLVSIWALPLWLIVGKLNQKKIFEDAGGLFVFIFSVLTLVGLWLTFASILEFRRIITSFSQLHERMLKLINETPKGQKVRILSYTPAIGYLALSENKWNQLKSSLENLKEHLEIVCLDNEDLNYWHNLFIGRKSGLQKDPLTWENTKNATEAANSLFPLASIKSKRKKLEMMPGFYLIFNDRKAIIVSPFFIPFPFGTPINVQQQIGKVQMFGVETTDWRIVEDVQALFEAYSNNVPDHPKSFYSKIGNLDNLPQMLQEDVKNLQQVLEQELSSKDRGELEKMFKLTMDQMSIQELTQFFYPEFNQILELSKNLSKILNSGTISARKFKTDLTQAFSQISDTALGTNLTNIVNIIPDQDLKNSQILTNRLEKELRNRLEEKLKAMSEQELRQKSFPYRYRLSVFNEALE